MAIATLVLWVLTAAAGLVLLTAGGAAKRAAAAEQRAAAREAPAAREAVPVPAPPVTVPGADPAPRAAGSSQAGPGSPQAGSGSRQAGSGSPQAGSGSPQAGSGSPQPALAPAQRTAGPAEPPPIPRVTVHATPGEHPLLEFSHPLLGLVGLGVWFIFVGTHHAPLAWVSFGILVAAIGAGLSWLGRNTLAARRGERPARAVFPPRLVLLHGLTASATFVVAVLTALIATHL